MGHRLISGAAKNCQIPHGHDEVVTVNIASKDNQGLDPNTNMLVEFEEAKGQWFKWIDQAVDHSFHINAEDPIIDFFRTNEPELLSKLLITPGDPTTEIRAACYHAKLNCFLNLLYACRIFLLIIKFYLYSFVHFLIIYHMD